MVHYNKAFEHLNKHEYDSAFLFFDKARQVFLESKDSIGVGECLVNMAIIQKDEGDYFGSQETALEADIFLNKTNPDHYVYISANYNNLGIVNSKLMDFRRAIEFYNLASNYTDDLYNNLIYQNNVALSYQHLNRYKKALVIFEHVLKSTPKKKHIEYARLLSNLARTKWLINKNYDPSNDFLRALKIRKINNDLLGMNASYVHLIEFYEKEKPNLALSYTKRAYGIAQQNNIADDKLYALSKLIELSPPAEAQKHFNSYKQLSDSVQNARTVAKNQFALIRYEVEKNKADNLLLQKENAETETRLTRQRFWTVGITASALLLLTGGLLLHKRRKQRIEMAAENKIKAVQLKTSRKVHDVVANGIYRVMTQIEYQPEFDRESILDSLEDMYNKSRDISYESDEQVVVQKPYNERISEMLRSFANDDCKILIAGNDAELWPSLSPEIRTEVHHVLQELMINMRKHSEASNVLIRFENTETNLQIYYSDNGQGIKIGKTYGNGLKNTVSRIKSLAGDINFASEEGKGLKVEVKIPLS